MLDHLHRVASQPRSGSDLLAVMDKAVRCMDQILGYRGENRFVFYYYETRGEEVFWQDNCSCGFVTGAWSTFIDEVAPVAEHYRVDVGCAGSPATHVLLIDRRDRRAYFAIRGKAKQFLARERGSCDGDELAQVPDGMVEITHEAIAQLAHEIWEKRGREAGRDLQNWLEAEATLKVRASGEIERGIA